MYNGVYNLKAFYNTKPGRLVRRLLVNHVVAMWPDLKDRRLMGYGYAVPYLRPLRAGTERTVAMMPSNLGVHFWPTDEKGLVFLGAEDEWPIETESIDRLIIVHSMEQAHSPDVLLQEAWRVLKSNGRLILIVPNRMGLWARAEWTPFGHGTPYTSGQINQYLRDQLFVHERTERALFMPPFKSFFMLRALYAFENIGRAIFPGLAGIYLVEASKQLYAGAARTKTKAARMQGRRVAVSAIPTS